MELSFELKAYRFVEFVSLRQALAPCYKFDLHSAGVLARRSLFLRLKIDFLSLPGTMSQKATSRLGLFLP